MNFIFATVLVLAQLSLSLITEMTLVPSRLAIQLLATMTWYVYPLHSTPGAHSTAQPKEAYTIKANMFPSGFVVPEETMTALPSGYSVGPLAVYGPNGETVSAFPSDEVAKVAVQAETSAPPSPSSPSAGGQSPSPSPSSNSAGRMTSKARGVALVAVMAAFFELTL